MRESIAKLTTLIYICTYYRGCFCTHFCACVRGEGGATRSMIAGGYILRAGWPCLLAAIFGSRHHGPISDRLNYSENYDYFSNLCWWWSKTFFLSSTESVLVSLRRWHKALSFPWLTHFVCEGAASRAFVARTVFFSSRPSTAVFKRRWARLFREFADEY